MSDAHCALPLSVAPPHHSHSLSRPLQRSRPVPSAAPSTPRTPSVSSPNYSLFAPPNSNRNSTDSWNSSVGADDVEHEWKPDQVRLLSRTLDALPPHLVTPFIGPTPPSNLLDKIANGVAHAKGSVEWPHSIRATRVKLIELSRARALAENDTDRESLRHRHRMQARTQVQTQAEFDANSAQSSHPSDHTDVKPHGRQRRLYRQSSMDFINPDELEVKDSNDIASVADRLHDRLASSANLYHPYHSSRASPHAASTGRTHTHRVTASCPRVTHSPLATQDFPATPSPRGGHVRSRTESSTNFSATTSSYSALGVVSGPHGSSHPRPLPDVIPRNRRVRERDRDTEALLTTPSKDLHKDLSKKENLINIDSMDVDSDISISGLGMYCKKRGDLADECDYDDCRAHTYPGARGVGSTPCLLSPKKMRLKDAVGLNLPLPLPCTPPPPPRSMMATQAGLGLGSPSVSATASPHGKKQKQNRVQALRATAIFRDCSLSPAPSATAGGGRSRTSHGIAHDSPHPQLMRPKPMSLSRNPSMFGGELPSVISVPAPVSTSASTLSRPPYTRPAAGIRHVSSPPCTPPNPNRHQQHLRRAPRLSEAAVAAAGRRISFGVGGNDELNGNNNDAEVEQERTAVGKRQWISSCWSSLSMSSSSSSSPSAAVCQLGSAFQLQ